MLLMLSSRFFFSLYVAFAYRWSRFFFLNRVVFTEPLNQLIFLLSLLLRTQLVVFFFFTELGVVKAEPERWCSGTFANSGANTYRQHLRY